MLLLLHLLSTHMLSRRGPLFLPSLRSHRGDTHSGLGPTASRNFEILAGGALHPQGRTRVFMLGIIIRPISTPRSLLIFIDILYKKVNYFILKIIISRHKYTIRYQNFIYLFIPKNHIKHRNFL